MLIREIIAELHDELARLERVIVGLEKLLPAKMPGNAHSAARTGSSGAATHRNRHGQRGSMNGAHLSAPRD